MKKKPKVREVDPIRLLARTDKHYLGGGDFVVFAPPHPTFLDAPGFWDAAHLLDLPVERAFTWAILDEDDQVVPFVARRRDWRPDRIRVAYAPASGVRVEETRVVLAGDLLASHLTISNAGRRARRLTLVLWSCQDVAEVAGVHGLEFDDGAFVAKRSFDAKPSIAEAYRLDGAMAWGLSQKANSFAAQASQANSTLPRFEVTPFPEKLSRGRLPNTIGSASGVGSRTHVFLALAARVSLPARGSRTLAGGCAIAPDRAKALASVHTLRRSPDVGKRSERAWRGFFSSMPSVSSSDAHVERYVAYREYGLRLFSIPGGAFNYPHPSVTEGNANFHHPITYSAPGHVREMRWCADPAVARGTIRNFVRHQRSDGSFPGVLFAGSVQAKGFYHGDWGGALLGLHAVHPDRTFLEEIYSPLVRYVEYFDRERDREGSGLYDVLDQYETGQEYMSRYLAVDPNADAYGWDERIRLKGIDATVYLYRLKAALALVADALGRVGDAARFAAGAARIAAAVRERMWDADEGMFFDIDPRSMSRTGVRAAVCFYPYMTDIVCEEHLAGLKHHLFDPREFWTPFPVPATAASDSTFNADAEWKGKRMSCPWNGRVWPMVNSHLVTALAFTAARFDDRLLAARASELLRSFLRMLFFDGDPRRPNCFEHYNPITGTPSIYHGIDDYQHSWVLDLIVEHVAGIRPQGLDSLVVRPLDLGLRRFRIDDVPWQGHRLAVEIRGRDVSVRLDGRLEQRGRVGDLVAWFGSTALVGPVDAQTAVESE
ncbi:MAG: hypothetical protein HYR85_14370 [Planctomycetes bacterium]|nr:hypothetical protein [Planctomycetota bacterium]